MKELLNLLWRLQGAGREWGHQPAPRPAAIPPAGPAAPHAFRAFFTPPEVAEEKVVIAPIGPEGVIPELHEAWTHGPDGRRSETLRGRAVTASRAVVDANAIKVKCGVCHQFDDLANSHCDWCGMGTCRLHRRVLADAERTHQLCPACFELGRHHLDTWAIQDTKARRAKS